MGCLLVCVCGVSDGQYGPPPPGYGRPMRRQGGGNNERKDDGPVRPSGYISGNVGFANPEGSYGAAVGGGYGGYAMAGYDFNLSLGIPVNHSNFGVALQFGSYSNGYDMGSYASNNGVSEAYPEEDVYGESSILGGLYVTFPLGRVVSIDGRLMGGVLLSTLPEVDYGYYDGQGDSYQYDLEPSNAASFAGDAGIGVRFLIAQFGRRRLCAMVTVDYLYSKVGYTTQQDIYEVPATGPNAGNELQLVPSPTFSGTLPVELLNVTFGLGYQL